MPKSYLAKNISLIFFLLYSLLSNAQLLSDSELERQTVYTSINEAVKNPGKVYKLDLSKKKLRKIPIEVFSLYNLQELNLSKNKLESIPSEIGNLTNLQKLNISANKISKLPSTIGNLTNLKELIANRNNINELPPEVGNLINLEKLDLWSNEIDKLPFEISKLQNNLKVLDMRVILINAEKQKAIIELLPETFIYFSKSCNCH